MMQSFKKHYKRVILIILDGVGIGELPDAYKYGDRGSNTLVNTSIKANGLKLPCLEKLGLGNLANIKGVKRNPNPEGLYFRMAEKSPGKDTTTGHWEICGIILDKPFPTFPDGFPKEFIEEFEKRINTKIIGNYPASGTEIINKLGDKHLKTGYPIVYTSADSVFQVAACEEIVPLSKLYEMCSIARDMLKENLAVARVIARPFVKIGDKYIRTENRKDFSLSPPKDTVLDCLKGDGKDVYAIGKIDDIFARKGITKSIHVTGNKKCMKYTEDGLKELKNGLIFTNLGDFDTLYGHRNDFLGFKKALEDFDFWLEKFIKKITKDDLLIITADHGCDPTTPSTDHSREYVPVVIYGDGIKRGKIEGRKSFSDLGKTIAKIFGIKCDIEGEIIL